MEKSRVTLRPRWNGTVTKALLAAFGGATLAIALLEADTSRAVLLALAERAAGELILGLVASGLIGVLYVGLANIARQMGQQATAFSEMAQGVRTIAERGDLRDREQRLILDDVASTNEAILHRLGGIERHLAELKPRH